MNTEEQRASPEPEPTAPPADPLRTDVSTRLIHHAYQAPSGFAAPQPGVFKASTVIFESVKAMRARDWRHRNGYTYGLHGTPTTFTLEERIATLEGARHCVLVPSGLAAITCLDMALLNPGDEVLLPANVYGPSREFARQELARWGIRHRLYDPLNSAALGALCSPDTKLIWLEAAGSVTMEFPDLVGLIGVAKAKGVITAIDNTWGAGLAFDAFALGVDVSAHALTKYPSGGGDVLMGSICTRSDALHEKIKLCHMRSGFGVGANDAEAVLRGLPSMALRYADGDQKSRALALWLGAQPQVLRVLHPALHGSPGHEHWAAVTTQAAGLFSVLLNERYTQAQVDAFVDALKLFRIGYSWAGPVSLAVPYSLAAMRDNPEYRGHLVRFSIGLEGLANLQADLAQALATLPAV